MARKHLTKKKNNNFFLLVVKSHYIYMFYKYLDIFLYALSI